MAEPKQQRWEYALVSLGADLNMDLLQQQGRGGWEAVGITTRGQIAYVLMKRPIDHAPLGGQ